MTKRARPLERAPKGTEKMPSMTEREKIHRLFKDFERGGFAARSRFVRAATWLGCCAHETGELTQAAVSRTAEAAAGGAGTVVSEFAYVSREGRAATRQWGLDCDRSAGEVRRLAADAPGRDDDMHAACARPGDRLADRRADGVLWGERRPVQVERDQVILHRKLPSFVEISGS